MTNSKHIPKRRFKEFELDGNWEEKSLSSITDVRDGTHNSPKYFEVGHPFVTSKNVADGYINFEDIQFICDEDFNEINKRSKVDVHDILMGMIGTVGNLALIRQTPSFAIKNVALIKYTGAINYEFLYQALQSVKVHRLIMNGMDGGTQKFISLKKIRDLKIPYTHTNEQLKLGKFFQTIDSLITLHKHKLDKLKNLKKSYLAELFPAEGERVPKRRFPGFEGEWEEKKLNEVIKDFIVPMRDKPKEFSGNIPWTRIEDIEGKYISKSHIGYCVSSETIKRMNLKIIPEGSLIVSASATFGVVAIVKNDLITNQTFIGLVPQNGYEIEFLYYLFQSPKIRAYMKEESAGSTIFYISRESFENMDIELPNEQERKLIIKQLNTLDSLLSLQQQKLDKLKDLKKAYLNELFV